MGVYLRGKAYYYDFYFRTKRYRGSFGPVSRKDALTAEGIKRQQAAVDEIFGKKKAYTWQKMCDDLLLYAQNNLKWNTTLRSHEQAIRSLEPFFRMLPPADIRPEHIEAYKRAMLAKGLKKSSVNTYLKTLRYLLNMAYQAGDLASPPIRKFRLIPEADESRTRIYSHEEEARLLLAAPSDLREKIILAMNTGMRAGELNSLTWQCVDFQTRVIIILSQYSKSGKTGFCPLNATAFGLLADMKPPGAEGRVFRNKTHGSTFVRAREKAGLDPALKFHSCRHIFATRLFEAGVPIVTVKELLRHSSIVQSMRYTHPDFDRLRSAVDLLSARSTVASITA